MASAVETVAAAAALYGANYLHCRTLPYTLRDAEVHVKSTEKQTTKQANQWFTFLAPFSFKSNSSRLKVQLSKAKYTSKQKE